MYEARRLLKGGRSGGGRGGVGSVGVWPRGWRGGTAGGVTWKIILLCILGVLGLMALLGAILKLRRRHFESRAEIAHFSSLVLFLMILFLLPPILFLAMDDHLAVGIVAIVFLVLLVVPFIAWIFIAVRKSKRLDEEPMNLRSVDTSSLDFEQDEPEAKPV